MIEGVLCGFVELDGVKVVDCQAWKGKIEFLIKNGRFKVENVRNYAQKVVDGWLVSQSYLLKIVNGYQVNKSSSKSSFQSLKII